MELLSAYNLIIVCSIIVIISFLFGELARSTNIPSVLMLIVFGIGLQAIMSATGMAETDFFPVLEVLGIVGLIMIVLEAAIELELKRDKLIPILKALTIALIGLVGSAWVAAIIIKEFGPEMDMAHAWLYATPLSILSSAIIIPSVQGLKAKKKEFHIYESTFSDILGIMMFYFIESQLESHDDGNGIGEFFGNLGLTLLISVVASYILILIFQRIKGNSKLFLLISILMLLYALGKQMHLSSLIIILIFGLLIRNMNVFMTGPFAKLHRPEKAKGIYDGLHILTAETAFIVRTFFFVIFGLTITLSHLFYTDVAIISGLILLSLYGIRFVLLRIMVGPDIFPQVFIAPRGLITILLFYAIPPELQVDGFEPGILLFLIITTSLIMTGALIYDKQRTGGAIKKAKSQPVGIQQWKAPVVETLEESVNHGNTEASADKNDK